MKDVGSFIKLDNNINEKVVKIKQKLLRNKQLLDYCQTRKIILNEDKIDKSLMNLLQFSENYQKCQNCTGLDTCTQMQQGYKPLLRDVTTHIHLQYTPCDYHKAYTSQLEVTNCLKSFYMPKKILNASLDNIDINDIGRTKALSKIATFAKSYKEDKFQKGAYIHGAFGIGKTYMLAAMANALAKRHIKVFLVYLPDMIRELKSAIGKNNLENLLHEIKSVQVLILDDIGSEMNTQWVRDEIIGPILQYRMLEELPTFFSSNKALSELIRDYATTTDNVKDVTKAERIGDRIKALAEEFTVSGKNYRY